MSILRSSITSLVLLTAITILGGSSVLGAPPVPFLDDNEPGIQFLFSGDPDTLESSIHDPNDPGPSLDCGRGAPRASTGGAGGKMHNDFLLCDNWDFQPRDWGKASFLQGAFILGHSPFSDDGGWSCEGNEGPNGQNPCVNSTIRAVTTFKNQPPPGPGSLDGAPMDVTKDWVFSFDFKISVPPGDTYGNDSLFRLSSRSVGSAAADRSPTSDLIDLFGAGQDISSFRPDGTPNRYFVHHGPFVEGAPGAGELNRIDIEQELSEGRLTLHYKAAVQKLDLWFNDELVAADFESFSGHYDIDAIQIGGGGISFENGLYDNVILGVLADSGACGPQGPGANPPGDFNCDGLVDVADLGIIGANFNGSEVTYVDGDANLDGDVDVADLGIVGANWSASQATGNTSALVPEPAILSLLAMSVLMVGRRRR